MGGGAVGVDNYLAMVVSTGIGGGIVLNGQLLDGADGNAGHIGHIFVAEGGRLMPPGRWGCWRAKPRAPPSPTCWTGSPPLMRRWRCAAG